jgi:hypothetical protein
MAAMTRMSPSAVTSNQKEFFMTRFPVYERRLREE